MHWYFPTKPMFFKKKKKKATTNFGIQILYFCCLLRRKNDMFLNFYNPFRHLVWKLFQYIFAYILVPFFSLLSKHERCLQDPGVITSASKIMALNYTLTAVSEDCLYLNVYTPSQRSASEKLPVSNHSYSSKHTHSPFP